MTESPRDRSTWTVLLLRGAGDVLEWTGGPRRLGAGMAAVLLAAVAAGVGIGLAWGERREAKRVAELRQRVERLRRGRARVRLLAARLDSVEGVYRRIRRVMESGPRPASERDVALPEVPSARPSRRAPRATRDSTGWSWPLAQEGFVTRSHRRREPGDGDRHEGLDIAVPVGSYVRAARRGVVAAAGEDALYGRYVELRHRRGYSSLYGHNRWLFVSAGDSVDRGEVIALSGNSGRSTAPHLHFEIVRDDRSVDPTSLLGEAMPTAVPSEATTRGGAP